jgi:hypothetical protein
MTRHRCQNPRLVIGRLGAFANFLSRGESGLRNTDRV